MNLDYQKLWYNCSLFVNTCIFRLFSFLRNSFAKAFRIWTRRKIENWGGGGVLVGDVGGGWGFLTV